MALVRDRGIINRNQADIVGEAGDMRLELVRRNRGDDVARLDRLVVDRVHIDEGPDRIGSGRKCAFLGPSRLREGEGVVL